MSQVVDVAIVGAGPAGTTLAAALASRGIEVLVLERAPAWQWRAGGVFTSPAAMRALERVGARGAGRHRATDPGDAPRDPGRCVARLTYGADRGPPAVGFDRSRLDPALEALARDRGVAIRRGARVTAVKLDPDGDSTLRVHEDSIRARIVVGADGSGSVVARAAGAARSARLQPWIGLTWHVVDPRPAADAPVPRPMRDLR